MKRQLVRAAQGAVLGTLAPLGWALVQSLQGVSPVPEIVAAPGVYLYMLVAASLAFAVYGFRLGAFESGLEGSSLSDPLTGLYNRRLFQRRLDQDVAAAERLQFPLSALVADLDEFRALRKRHGPLAGDVVLRAVAQHFLETQRKGDTIARVGPDSIAVILPFTNSETASRVAERLRSTLAERPLRLPNGTQLQVTASFGVSAWRPGSGERAATLLQRIENALENAKRLGRNRIVNIDEIPGADAIAGRPNVVPLPARVAPALGEPRDPAAGPDPRSGVR